MNRKSKIVVALIIAIFTLYSIFIMAQASDPIGKYVSVKGGELEDVEGGQWATYQIPINDLHLAWARIHVKWNSIDETGRGIFDFSDDPDYAKYKKAITIAKDMGAEVIITIKAAPPQLIEKTPIATAPNGTLTPWPDQCGRINSEGVDRLKEFIVALLKQLRSDFNLGENDPPPVHYIELWNEPDAAAYYTSPDVYGCWVYKDNGTPMYQNGGVYYAQVFNTVAFYVKSQFPVGSVKFVAGAEMSGNPEHEFLKTVIDNAINNIDVVSYHQYVFIYNNNSQCVLATPISTYESSFSDVRNYLDTHGGSSISILISEGAMGYNAAPTPGATASPTPATAFYNCQARFAESLLTWAEGKENSGLLGFIWYTIDNHNWRDTGLLNSTGTPKPVYYIWRDFGPVLYIPLFYVADTEGPQSDLMNAVVQSESSGLVEAYPLPLGASTTSDLQQDTGHESLTNPYPAPGK